MTFPMVWLTIFFLMVIAVGVIIGAWAMARMILEAFRGRH
jgi:uncharacterized membrane protein